MVTAELDIQIHLLYHIYNRWILAFLNKKEGDIMLIEIDFSSDEAIYQQLCNQIILGIATSRLTDGDVLPSVRQMADDIGINMHTVNKAYSILRQEGFVKVDRRRGAFVSVDDRNRERALRIIEKDMRVLLAEARCRGLSKEDLLMLVDRIYDEYDGGIKKTDRYKEIR